MACKKFIQYFKKKKLTALRVHKLSPTSLLTELSGLYLPRSDEMGIVALDVAVNIKISLCGHFVLCNSGRKNIKETKRYHSKQTTTRIGSGPQSTNRVHKFPKK
mmetsp:Transcript_5628/g.6924  ORF Transcript_5628/g.6924 Transcript_5628/m.6924 type:complete len:104 (+) Transcript_5628:1594-1905(+)